MYYTNVSLRSLVGNLTALHWSALSGSDSTINVLLSAGSDPNALATAPSAPPLSAAAFAGSSEAILALIEGGADIEGAVDKDGVNALHLAAWNGDPDATAIILAESKDEWVKTKASGRGSPLLWAVERENLEAAQIILDALKKM